MAYSARLSEVEPIIGAVRTSGSTGSWYTDAIDLSTVRRARFLVIVPTLSGGATVDFGVQTSATSGGAYAALSGASITQETTGNKVFDIEVSTEAVVNASGNQYMKGYLKVGTATASPLVVCYGAETPFKPASDTATGAQAANVYYA